MNSLRLKIVVSGLVLSGFLVAWIKLYEKPLVRAARKGDLEAVRSQIEKDVQVDLRGKEGKTPLHVAAGEGHLEVVEFLLSKGAAVNALDNNQNTPLEDAIMWAGTMAMVGDLTPQPIADERSETLIEVLLKAGADPNPESAAPPLYWAGFFGATRAAELLLTYGAEVNAEGICGTPLHAAASNGRSKTVKVLLNYGADANAVNCEGLTPKEAARFEMHGGVVELLEEYDYGDHGDHPSQSP